jgi:hypothetical protein
MTVLLAHKCVRNDNHCPTCRCYYVSIHKSKDDAVEHTKTENEIYGDDLEKLERSGSVWIHEWEQMVINMILLM